MMRFFLLAFLLFPGLLYSQPEGYVLTVFIDEYKPLQSPSMVAQGADFVSYPGIGLLLDKTVPLDFTYSMFGHTTNQLYFNFHCCLVSELLFTPLTNQATTIMGPRVMLANRSSMGTPTNITKETVGSDGDRITKLQWQNFGFFGDANLADFMNFQVWIYEQGQVYEYRMGPRSVSGNFDQNFVTGKPTFSFVYNMTNYGSSPNVEGFYFTTSMNPPAMHSLDNSDYASMVEGNFVDIGLDHFPPEGTVFRISDGSLVTTRGIMLNDYIEVYPTATETQFHVALTHDVFSGTLSLIDMNGRTVLEQQAETGTHTLQVGHLPAGTYILNIRNEKESVFYRVVKI